MTVQTPTRKDAEENPDLAGHFQDLIAGFFAAPADTVRQRLEQEREKPGSSIAVAWGRANPQTPEEISRFYQETDTYVYALAADHCQPQRQAIWDIVLRRIERRRGKQEVLLYGDGIGTDSIAVARRGHSVTYFDLPGITSRFALFRFGREGLGDRIRVLHDADSIPREAFDAVVCIEVLEHLPDPISVMKDLVSYSRFGGILLLTESFGSVGPDHPSHLPSNLPYAGLTNRIMDRFGVANTFYNTDPVNYPMEFTKVRPGPRGALVCLFYRLRRALDTRLRALLRKHRRGGSPHTGPKSQH